MNSNICTFSKAFLVAAVVGFNTGASAQAFNPPSGVFLRVGQEIPVSCDDEIQQIIYANGINNKYDATAFGDSTKLYTESMSRLGSTNQFPVDKLRMGLSLNRTEADTTIELLEGQVEINRVFREARNINMAQEHRRQARLSFLPEWFSNILPC